MPFGALGLGLGLTQTPLSAVPAATTFNIATANKPTITTISGGGLTIENTAQADTVSPANPTVQCLTTRGIPLGVKAYWEVLCVVDGGAGNALGAIQYPGHDYFNFDLGGGGDDLSLLFTRGGTFRRTNASITGVGAWTTASVICFALDRVLHRAAVRVGIAGNWNGNVANDPATGYLDISTMNGSALIYPTPGLYPTGCKDTFRFAPASVTGAIPPGYSTLDLVAA